MKQWKITQRRLKQILQYVPETGYWLWKIQANQGVPEGSVAGYIKKDGYRYITVDGEKIKASRLAFLYMEGYFPEHFVDHINRRTHDDSWNNLRHVTSRCNTINSKKPSTNTSGVKGVSFIKKTKKWKAAISLYNKSHFLGTHDTLLEAAYHRLAAEQCLGWHTCDTDSSAYNYIRDQKASDFLDSI